MGLINNICIIVLLVSITLVDSDISGQQDLLNQREEGKTTKVKSRLIQKAAIQAWANYLEPERDYNATSWITKDRNQPQYDFDYYVSLLSNLFLEKGATVNFALVGACDGTNDNTIRNRYLPNAHWRALFVEPISLNFADLNKFLVDNKVSDRSHTIQAAVTNECTSPTIIVKTPNVDQTAGEDTTKPHWMRRQIGGIVEINPDVSIRYIILHNAFQNLLRCIHIIIC